VIQIQKNVLKFLTLTVSQNTFVFVVALSVVMKRKFIFCQKQARGSKGQWVKNVNKQAEIQN
jgi:hypothetical protein